MGDLEKNLIEIRARIQDAERRCGRKAGSARLIAVTKTVPASVINEAIALGVVEIGENKAQEWTRKLEFVNIQRNYVHFIGQIQSNKLKYILKTTNIIHSLDKLPTAEELNRLCIQEGTKRQALIQVNIGREPQKAGVLEEELPKLLEGISPLGRVEVVGLMCIPPFGEEACGYFGRLRELSIKMSSLSLPNVSMDELSMGMSSDYEEAIMEGATMVRIGSALFGARGAGV